jgi:hypothetical protein
LDGQQVGDPRVTALLSPAAKLFASSQIPELLHCVEALDGAESAGLQALSIDAQIEDMYMGPAALQRRLVSAAMTGTAFLHEFQLWSVEADALAQRCPQTGMRSLTEGMRLWHWTLERLQESADARGAKLYCDARQGVTFAMADALCGLLAARSLALDFAQWETEVRPPNTERSIFLDLGILASGRAASRVAQVGTDLLCGYAQRFPIATPGQKEFARRRANLYRSLRGVNDARERLAEFSRARPAGEANL